MNRVPIHTPSAPSASAAARPRPSKIPPAATTGISAPTASTIWGTSGMVATRPVWPPASVPWATTRSHPASRARRAWSTLPHMLTTSTSLRWQSSTTSAGTPRPGHEHRGPTLDDLLDLGDEVAGHGGEQVDAEGLVGRCLAPRPSRRPSARSLMVDAPRHPNPPASDTAVTSGA